MPSTWRPTRTTIPVPCSACSTTGFTIRTAAIQSKPRRAQRDLLQLDREHDLSPARTDRARSCRRHRPGPCCEDADVVGNALMRANDFSFVRIGGDGTGGAGATASSTTRSSATARRMFSSFPLLLIARKAWRCTTTFSTACRVAAACASCATLKPTGSADGSDFWPAQLDRIRLGRLANGNRVDCVGHGRRPGFREPGSTSICDLRPAAR